jgi:hypothetical protein
VVSSEAARERISAAAQIKFVKNLDKLKIDHPDKAIANGSCISSCHNMCPDSVDRWR